MTNLLRKASSQIGDIPPGKFEKFNLVENPFPAQAILNKDSKEKKFNGSIYEPEIRTAEYEKLLNNFIRKAQNDLNHQRLGFIQDSSYIGRGNGKTAFLLNMVKKINAQHCLDLSDNLNKCFAIYFQPESGGKTKTFDVFTDIFFQAILDNEVIKHSLAILRLEAIIKLKGKDVLDEFASDEEIINNLNDGNWLTNNEKIMSNISHRDITLEILKNDFLQDCSNDFPLVSESRLLLSQMVIQSDFEKYYNRLKKGKERFDFVFTDLIKLFLAAGFNGAYIFVDDFERIPDHQSAIQKKDFVTQLRTILYDGLYLNSRIGFYNLIFALHAGVPRILQEAWGLAGLEHRVSINPSFDNPMHMILFEKINETHAVMLIKKYLSEYRIAPVTDGNYLFPFEEEALKTIGIKSELNAAKILQLAFNIIDKAATENLDKIDNNYVLEFTKSNLNVEHEEDNISTTETIDLASKAQKKD